MTLQSMKQAYYCYIIKCSDDGTYYVGSAANLKDRVDRHNQGRGPTYNAKRRPVQLVYHERFNSLEGAVIRERQKKWFSAKKEALISGELERLKKISKSR